MTDRQWTHGAVTVEGITLGDDTLSVTLPRRFFNYFVTDGILRPLEGGGGHLAGIGYTRTGDDIAIRGDTGQVVLVRKDSFEIASMVNTNLEAFCEFMGLCEDRYPYYTDEGDLDDSIEASDGLRSELSGIDPAALREGSYWSDFLSDVAIGDYAEVSDDGSDE
jgi:SUKH-4 immunity protein